MEEGDEAMSEQTPMLMESLLTRRVFVVTSYKDKGNGVFEARQKYDVTEQFDALVEKQLGTCEMETDWDYLHDGIPDAPEDTWAYKCSVCEESFRYDRGIMPSYCPNCGRKVKHDDSKESNRN